MSGVNSPVSLDPPTKIQNPARSTTAEETLYCQSIRALLDQTVPVAMSPGTGGNYRTELPTAPLTVVRTSGHADRFTVVTREPPAVITDECAVDLGGRGTVFG